MSKNLTSKALLLMAVGALAVSMSGASCPGSAPQVLQGEPGAPGPAGEPGGGGGSGGGVFGVQVSGGKWCAQFAEKAVEDTNIGSLEFTVVPLNPRCETIPNLIFDTQISDSHGCVEDLQLVAGYVNRVEIRKTLESSEVISVLVKPDSSELAQSNGGTFLATLPMSTATDYLEELCNLGGQDLAGASSESFDAVYALVVDCSDLSSDAWDEDLLDEQGDDAFSKCLQENNVTSVFAKNQIAGDSGAVIGGACVQVALKTDLKLDDGGSTAADNLSLGVATFAGAQFSSTETGVGEACIVTTFNGVAATVSYVVAGVTINGASISGTCEEPNFDDKYDGIHGTYPAVAADLNGHIGAVLLSKGPENTTDNLASSIFKYIPAMISYFGLETTDTASDMEFGATDKQTWALGNTLGTGAYGVAEISNMPEEIAAAGLLAEIDENTSWFIVSGQASGTLFADTDTDGIADGETYQAAIEDASIKALLIQECNPSDKVEFVAPPTVAATVSVTQTLNESVTIASEDADNRRMIGANLLLAVFDPTNVTQYSDMASATFERIAATAPVSGFLGDVRNLIDGGAANIPAVRLARIVAQTQALCVKEITQINSPDDVLLSEFNSSDSDSEDNTLTNFLALPMPVNCYAAGLAPQQEYTVSGCADVGKGEVRADRYGVAAWQCGPSIDADGTLVQPETATVTSGGQSFDIPVEAL